MEKKKFLSTKEMVELAVLIAITIIMGTTFLGTIRTPFLSISLVTIPVAIAAIVLGPKGGFICGTVFGLTSLFNAVTGTSGMLSVLMTVNAFGVVFTALVPRMLEGLFTAFIFKGLHSVKPIKTASYYISALCCPLLNTLMFMSCIILFFYKTDYIQGLVEKFGATNPLNFVVALVGVQGIIEAVTCLIIGGAISQVVVKVVRK